MNKIDLLFKNLDLSEAKVIQEDPIKKSIVRYYNDLIKEIENSDDDTQIKTAKNKHLYIKITLKAYDVIKNTNEAKIKEALNRNKDPQFSNSIVAAWSYLYKITTQPKTYGLLARTLLSLEKLSLDKYDLEEETIKKIRSKRIKELGSYVKLEQQDFSSNESSRTISYRNLTSYFNRNIPPFNLTRAKNFFEENKEKTPNSIWEKVFRIIDKKSVNRTEEEKNFISGFLSISEVLYSNEEKMKSLIGKAKNIDDEKTLSEIRNYGGEIYAVYPELSRSLESSNVELFNSIRNNTQTQKDAEKSKQTPQTQKDAEKSKQTPQTQKDSTEKNQTNDQESPPLFIKISDNRITPSKFLENQSKIINFWKKENIQQKTIKLIKKIKEDKNLDKLNEEERTIISNFYYLYTLHSKEEHNKVDFSINIDLNNILIDIIDDLEINENVIKKLKGLYDLKWFKKSWEDSSENNTQNKEKKDTSNTNTSSQNPNRLPSAVERDKKEQEKKEGEDKEEVSDEEKIAQALDIEPTAEQIKASKSEVKGKAKKEVQAKILNLPNENNDREYFDKIKKEAGSSRKKQKALEKVWNQYLKGIKQIAEQLRKKTYMTPEASYAMARSYRDLMLSKARTAILSGGVVRTGKRIADSWERSKERRKSGRTFRRTRRKEKRIHRTGDSVPFGKIRKNWDEEEGLTGAAKISGRIIKRKGKTLASRLKATASRADRLQDQRDKSKQERPLGDERKRKKDRERRRQESEDWHTRRRIRNKSGPYGLPLTKKQQEDEIEKEKEKKEKERRRKKLRELGKKGKRTVQRAKSLPGRIRDAAREFGKGWKEEE